MKKQLSINNQVGDIEKVSLFLEELTSDGHIPEDLSFSFNLVLEELVSNIIFYGFNDEKNHIIEIIFTTENNLITINLIDDGIPFNMMEVPTPDHLNKSAEDREVGGLGIYFVKTLMDNISYERLNNTNQLTITKQIQ